jgi:hypothetical protein
LSLTKIEDRSTRFGSENYSQEWLTIEEYNRVKTILESYSDEQKRSIIHAVMDRSLGFLEIAQACKIPLASCHRKIYSLIEEGLLVGENSNLRIKSKRYRSAFKEMRINVKKDAIIVDVKQHLLG